MANFKTVKDYIYELGFDVSREIPEEEILVINEESKGIQNLIIDCEDSILILEQFILPVSSDKPEVYKRLLQMNRNLVHGAFVLDEDGSRVLFRDTLQLANLDLNELEASIDALSLALAEYAEELISFAQ